ncbi:putative DNA-binding protein, partial [Mycoplasma putrefaciens]
MNHLINKTVNLSSLFRIYQDLLTSKQKQYFELYIDENW